MHPHPMRELPLRVDCGSEAEPFPYSPPYKSQLCPNEIAGCAFAISCCSSGTLPLK